MNKPHFFRGPDKRIPVLVFAKGEGSINLGSTLTLGIKMPKSLIMGSLCPKALKYESFDAKGK